MGKSCLAISNVGSSTRRKPLGLKPQQSNSKKAFKKTGAHEPSLAANKENASSNILYGVQPDKSSQKKVSVAADVIEESAERLAIRRRVEEAVAAHLASRVLETEVSDKSALEPNTEEPIVEATEDIKIVEEEVVVVVEEISVPSPAVNTQIAPKATNIVWRLMSFLMVVSVAVWACLRITMIEPVPLSISLHKFDSPLHYAPPMQQVVSAVIVDDILALEPIEPATSTEDVSMEETPVMVEVVQEEVEAPVDAIENAAPVEVDADSVIDLDAIIATPSNPNFAPIADLIAPSASAVIAHSPTKFASGHVVASVRKLAEFLRPVKDFIRKLGAQANSVAERLRKWLRF